MTDLKKKKMWTLFRDDLNLRFSRFPMNSGPLGLLFLSPAGADNGFGERECEAFPLEALSLNESLQQGRRPDFCVTHRAQPPSGGRRLSTWTPSKVLDGTAGGSCARVRAQTNIGLGMTQMNAALLQDAKTPMGRSTP